MKSLSFLNYFSRHVLCSVILSLTIAVYWQVCSFDFINFDDPIYIVDNSFVNTGLSWENLYWAFTTSHAGNWHPVTWISHMIDSHIFGLDPGGHHFINLFVHLVNISLVYLFLYLATKRVWPSALVAALFALHPLHVESVAWVSERKDVLSTMFMFLALISYQQYNVKKSRAFLVVTFLLFGLGLLSKPMLVTFPVLLLLLDIWPLERIKEEPLCNDKEKLWKLLYEKWAFFALSAFSAIGTFYAQHSSGAVKSLETFTVFERFANALKSYVVYLYQSFWPYDLAIFYPYQKTNLFLPAIASAVALVLVTLGVIKLRDKLPYFTVGWFWYLISLLPVIGIIQVGEQSHADRYTYIPLLGIFVAFSWGIETYLKKRPKIAVAVKLSLAAIVVVFSLITLKQVGYWKNSKTLFENASLVTVNNHTAYSYLAKYYLENNELNQAEHHYRKAIEVNPGYQPALINLGVIWAQKGKNLQAEKMLLKALEKDSGNAKIYNNLGNIERNKNKPDAALAYYNKAIQLESDYKEALFNQGNILSSLNRYDSAINSYKKALEVDPNFAEVYNGLGVIEAKKGNYTKAVGYFTSALGLSPDLKDAKKNISKIKNILDQTQK